MSSKFIPFGNVEINQGFWYDKQKQNAQVTVYSVYEQFKNSGRFEALKLNWKEGEPNRPHFFWDSDIAKWIEAAANVVKTSPDERLEKLIDELIDKVAENQEDSGYFNSYYMLFEPQNRWTRRIDHELYCAGHYIEAAAAYYSATKKDKLLLIVCKYANYIEKVFVTDKSASFITPGHPEIELALVRLYECTGENRYLELSKFFIDKRGTQTEEHYPDVNPKYAQDHLPVREQKTAEGHAVRACYLYSGMADIARIYDDHELINACKAIFENITNKRMYITGGIGSSNVGEAFTIDYDLPNLTAYSESCAAIALAFFAKRMLMIDNNSKYADIIEKIFYNGFLSSISLDGKAFFYENPLEIFPKFKYRDSSIGDGTTRLPITQRLKLFECSCCPPNISRLIASIGDYIYLQNNDTLYIHQFINSKTIIEDMEIIQSTNYPCDGIINIKVKGFNGKIIAIRIPAWCDSYKIKLNGELTNPKTSNGYVVIDYITSFELTINFEMKVQLIEANPRVVENAGRVAVTRGPIVYCMEGCDNGELLKDIFITDNLNSEIKFDELFNSNILYVDGFKRKDTASLYQKANNDYLPQRLKLIPYFAFANRGETEMQVWLLKR